MTTNPQPEASEPPEQGISEKKRRGQERAARRAARAKAAAAAPEDAVSAAQIRLARRAALRHGIEADTDRARIEALRARGIDPFEPSQLLKLVARDDDPAMPKVVVIDGTSEAAAQATEMASAVEIMDIQRDISRRRRRSTISLLLRLCLFVLIPTLCAAYYFAQIATPLYKTETEFLVQKSGSAGGGLGSLFSGTALGSSQEAVAVQRYLGSMAALVRLDDEVGYRAQFTDPNVDRLQRLALDAPNESVLAHYKRHVSIGYDPTEGVVRLTVLAPSPEAALAFAQALTGYAEEVVDALSKRQREDQVQGARDSFEDARQAMIAAQMRVQDLQEARGVLSAEAEASSLMGQLTGFEMQLRQERLRRDEMLANARPNATKLAVNERSIARLEAAVSRIRTEMTQTGEDGRSLVQITGELVVAEADLQTRQLLLQQAMQQLESARTEAARQVGYLALNVAPVLPEAPAYPRVVQNSLLAFLVFAGIYLVMSLTASVLREQVSG